ncbi:uncharacterized protein LOC128849824 [Cuculus canorus]|uniref:uncharacterized protein LOC128849824 n=1 Tax=Cuculus canorus TaxID=55661 RepID=UPI0023AB36A4|nr:uncharacterized protein LOC128849824 [Cuculus canorus]
MGRGQGGGAWPELGVALPALFGNGSGDLAREERRGYSAGAGSQQKGAGSQPGTVPIVGAWPEKGRGYGGRRVGVASSRSGLRLCFLPRCTGSDVTHTLPRPSPPCRPSLASSAPSRVPWPRGSARPGAESPRGLRNRRWGRGKAPWGSSPSAPPALAPQRGFSPTSRTTRNGSDQDAIPPIAPGPPGDPKHSFAIATGTTGTPRIPSPSHWDHPFPPLPSINVVLSPPCAERDTDIVGRVQKLRCEDAMRVARVGLRGFHPLIP